MGIRDRRYLNWRYTTHPYHSYRVLAAEQNNGIVGYIVARTAKLLGLNSGIIVDLLAHPDFMGCADSLLRAAIASFERDTQLDLVAAMMTKRGSYTTALQRHGFIRTPQVFWFILHLDDQRTPQGPLTSEENWYLTWGDTDVI